MTNSLLHPQPPEEMLLSSIRQLSVVLREPSALKDTLELRTSKDSKDSMPRPLSDSRARDSNSTAQLSEDTEAIPRVLSSSKRRSRNESSLLLML